MCGIFGIINKKIAIETAGHCLDTLAHRGPDGRGLWQEDGVILGHRRLSILDLSDNGKQPMFYADNRYVITFNGEIYNFIEIRNELTLKGYRFASDSDTEVILASYTEWKEECLLKFNGMWAFAIWDRKKKELLLARDRFGIKPLYYTKLDDSGFAFASEMKALISVMDKKEINYDIVRNTNLIMTYESGNDCLLNGIHRVPAGHYAIINKHGMQMKEWWCTIDHLIKVPERYEEQVEMFRSLFLDACRLRMRSDVTIGTALSGGLDSSSTISAMSYLAKNQKDMRMNQDWQHAFVATFPGTSLDESNYAKMVTDHLGIESTFLNINPLKYWSKIEDALYLFEEIYYTSPIPMMALYGEQRRAGTIVTIDGHGADELMGGYPWDFIHAFHDAGIDIKDINNIAETYIGLYPTEGNLAISRSKLKLYSNYIVKDVAKSILGRNRAIDHLFSNKETWRQLDRLNKVLYRATHMTVLPTLLRNYDRYSMANGVEIRMPFMDYRIVEFAFSIGWRSKIHNGYSKSIIRDAMASFMPEPIAYRKTKIGFNTPFVEWMQGDLKEWFGDLVSSGDFINSEVIEGDAVKKKVLEVINNKTASYGMAENAWTAMMPYLWKKYFYERV